MSRSQRQGWRPLSGWWLSVFLLLSALSLMLPPMQSPDENAHLLRAGMLAEGQWRLQPAPADTPRDLAGLGGWVDKNLIDFSSTYLAVATRTQGMPPSEIKTQVASLHWALETAFYPVPGTGYYFPLIYAPQAIALWVGRAANLTMAHSYQLVRTTTLLLVCTLLALAWGRLPPNPAVIAILHPTDGLIPGSFADTRWHDHCLGRVGYQPVPDSSRHTSRRPHLPMGLVYLLVFFGDKPNSLASFAAASDVPCLARSYKIGVARLDLVVPVKPAVGSVCHGINNRRADREGSDNQ